MKDVQFSFTCRICFSLYAVAPTPWGTGHVPPLLQIAGHGGTVRSRTTNKKLTKLYSLSRKRSLKRLIVLLEPKKWRGTTKKKNFRRFAESVTPTFKFVPAPLFVCVCVRACVCVCVCDYLPVYLCRCYCISAR